jgi:carbon monoxide dehydrogenase subunit G
VKVEESFVIDQPQERLWSFFERVDQVARCVPGVDAVEQLDADNSSVRVTQAVGPMTATFDLKMRITERRPQELMRFTAIGRAVRGAAGNVRSVNTVRLEPVAEGTRVALEADVALGGMLGSVGQKVVAKQAGKMTGAFADALERELRGERAAPAAAAGEAAPAAEARAPRAPAAAPAPAAPGAPAPAAPASQPAPADWLRGTIAVPVPVAAGAVALVAALVARGLGRRR